jgi:hypothetical protein
MAASNSLVLETASHKTPEGGPSCRGAPRTEQRSLDRPAPTSLRRSGGGEGTGPESVVQRRPTHRPRPGGLPGVQRPSHRAVGRDHRPTPPSQGHLHRQVSGTLFLAAMEKALVDRDIRRHLGDAAARAGLRVGWGHRQGVAVFGGRRISRPLLSPDVDVQAQVASDAAPNLGRPQPSSVTPNAGCGTDPLGFIGA